MTNKSLFYPIFPLLNKYTSYFYQIPSRILKNSISVNDKYDYRVDLVSSKQFKITLLPLHLQFISKDFIKRAGEIFLVPRR